MFLSFIVPVYNVEEYLKECLDSLLNQDIPYEDYEIICVNDGSTDGSLYILKHYEQTHPNIRVIDQQNSGVALARNAGLDAAEGEYVWFVDSDDLILPNVLCKVRNQVHTTDCDRLIVCNYVVTGIIPEAAALKEVPKNRPYYNSVVWRSVLRRQFLQRYNIRFHYPKLILAEDCIFMHELLISEPRTFYGDQLVYVYRNHPGSATTANSNIIQRKKLDTYVEAAKIMQEHYKNDLVEKRNSANLLMQFLWNALCLVINLPRKEGAAAFQELKNAGLFPYNKPDECDLVKSYQTSRTDWIGKLFDKVYINMHRPWGFAVMCLLQNAIRLKHNICK